MTTTGRYVWLDWMKMISMYCIIAGHILVPGNEFIYVFSVPCFFILSGFLSKREQVPNVFWKKIWWNLVVPMFILFFINKLLDLALKIVNNSFQIYYLWQMPLNGLMGFHGKDLPAGGLGALWFVYTLVVLKIILQFIPAKNEKITLTLISLLMLIGAVALNKNGVIVYNAVVDVLLAMPFFTIGYLLRPYKERIATIKLAWMPLFIIIGGLVVWFCGTYNDTVFLWRCSYGNNLFLCIAGALFGTTAIYGISRLLESNLIGLANIIGSGTIIILGFHYFFTLRVYLPLRQHFLPIGDWFLYFDALIVLLAFVPVILFCRKYFKILYGVYRK